MTTGHSRLAPSAADRWVFCPASVRMSEAFPQLVEDPSAAEGTASHWAGFSMLKTHTPKPGDICPENGVQLTEEMLEGALVYANAIFAIANQLGGLSAAILETRVFMPSARCCTAKKVWHYFPKTVVFFSYSYYNIFRKRESPLQ